MGFTLLEVSVAVTLGLLILGVGYGVYVTSAQFVSRWKQHVQAENELHLFTRRFSQEVRTARGIRHEAARELALHHEGGSEIIYTWENGALFRNGTPVRLSGVAEPGTFVVQRHGGRVYVELTLPVRLSGVAGAPISRSVDIGAVPRLPIAWKRATQPSDGSE